MRLAPPSRRITGALIVLVAVAGGIVAAAVGGHVEGILDWVFVGVPLLIVAGSALATYARNHRSRSS
jgi:hypothetical protein